MIVCQPVDVQHRQTLRLKHLQRLLLQLLQLLRARLLVTPLPSV
jgi:hypothetical protein